MPIENAPVPNLQAERDLNLTTLVYISRKLGALEGVSSTQAVPDPRITTAKVDLFQLYERLIDMVGLSNNMRLQEKELAREDYEEDYHG